MNTRVISSAGLVGVSMVALAFAAHQPPEPAPTTETAPTAVAADADRDAVLKTASEFEAAFNRGDAQAIAAMHTGNAESRDAAGQVVVGRAAIEKTYATLFAANPGAKVEVLVGSVRFPATGMAVEEGLLRFSHGPKDLPATSAYVAIHAREGDGWKIALSSEGGVGEYRLEDLDWLLGDWVTKSEDAAVTLSFARDPAKPVITGTFTRTPTGKEPLTGTIRVALDPETGHIRSWGFEDDGAHSQSLWHCDGKSWILDLRGVLADGTPTAERVILQRAGPDAITWRAVDRLLDDEPLADTPPMRLTRKPEPK